MRKWSKHLATAAAIVASAGLGGCGNQSAGDAGNPSAQAADGAGTAGPAGALERGRYLASIMDCAGCHNSGAFSPQPANGPLEGGTVGFEVPGLGVFYPPNLTSHPEAGLGRWSVEEIMAAVRAGRRPDGRELAPAMPWRAYSALTDADARALATYLKSLPPSANRVPGPSAPETAPRAYLTVRAPGGASGEGATRP